MPRPSIETAGGWRDKTMVDREGAPLGRIAHIYLDRVTGEPEWALVATEQGGRRVFVPLADAAEQQDQIGVPVERALVSDAPAIRAGRQLSKEDTARLHGHYGGAPQLRWASAKRAPGGGLSARLLLAAGAAVSSVVGGLLLARRRRRRQPSGLVDAVRRTAPLAAAGRAVAGAGRRVRVLARLPRPRKPKKRRTRMAGKLKLLAGLAAGYVLGARAGRERYERIAEATRRLAERPQVRELTGKLRSGLGAGLEQAADIASDRLQQVRGEDHGRTRSQPPEAGRADESERDGGASSPGAGPSSRGRRERSPSGR